MKPAAIAVALLVAAPGEIALDRAPAQGGLVRGRAPVGTVRLLHDGREVPLAPDRGFMIGFSRDAPPASALVIQSNNGTRTVQGLVVARVARPVRNLPTLPKQTPRTAAEIARRAAEVARVDAARAPLRRLDGWRQSFIWPVTGRISGVFGSRTTYAGEPGGDHSGVDVARPAGTPVAAPADGIVALASPPMFSLEGNLLVIDHGFGLSSSFLHLSRIDVKPGDAVRRGQTVGAIGTTGRSTGPHLHWGMVLRGVRIDPQAIAGPMVAAR